MAQTSGSGAFATHMTDQQWVGYDSMQDVQQKAGFVQASGFGGVAVSTLDLDDFSNLCCQGAFPLLSTVSNVILGTSPPAASCTRPLPPVTPAPRPQTVTDPWDDGSSNKNQWTQQQSTTAWTTQKPTTTTTTAATTTTTDAVASGGDQGEECEDGKYYRNPQTCQKYYR